MGAHGLISLDLELMVGQEEASDFYNQEAMLFPLLGMRCPVSLCSREHYPTFSAYMKHWRQFHHSTSANYVCQICGRQFLTRPHAVTCVRRHGFQGAAEHVTSVAVKNEDYIEPEGNFAPRKGTPEERQQLVENEVRKKVAARERWRRVSEAPEIPNGEGLSRENYVDIRFCNGKTFARRIIRGSNMTRKGDSGRFVKHDVKYEPNDCFDYYSRD